MNWKKRLHPYVSALARWLGSDIVDYRTGRTVARALIICVGGRIYLFGLRGESQVIPVFLPQKRMSFWKHQIGFTVHPPVDFPSEPPPPTAE